ncbi:MAG: hypothetical protein GTO02_20725, partial [Candidatus Dadabacteria bacterium]|nr:hypothetical protein [Candidatus Dadabacteria bacterium]NIQ16715.1 hypothetical protein [Candidatus Dadabacteria bacterium]
MKIFILLNIFIFLSFVSCVTQPQQRTFPKKVEAKNSATTVVSDFLEALKNRNFKSAYKQVYIINSDEQGYISRFESIYNDYDLKIINYRILGTQLYRDTAIVVAEVEVDFKSPSKTERSRNIYRNQYDLSIVENLWKITKDKCI